MSRSETQYLVWEGLNGQLWYAESTRLGWLGDAAGSPGDGPLGSQPVAIVAAGKTGAPTVLVYWKDQDLNIWSTSSPTAADDWAPRRWVEHRP